MRFVRYRDLNNLTPKYGWALLDGEDYLVGPLEGDPFSEFRRFEATLEKDQIHLLAPVQPTKIICIGRNYIQHAKEQQVEVPEVPLIFLKPPSAIIGPGGVIQLPPQSQQVEHEAELVVVIGKRGRWISAQDALDHIFGYTIGNDVTARDLQRRDVQWTRSKGFDTFCPIGPWIITDFDPSDALITCYVNEEMRQMASTRDIVFNIRQLIAFASSVMTLEIGDIIMTGTPAGVGRLEDGDIVEITIEGIGTLTNSVVAETSR